MLAISKITTFVVLLTLAAAGVGLYFHPGVVYPLASYFDSWLYRIIQFSLLQAFLSACFAVVLAVPIAVLLSERPFYGQWLFKGLLNLFFIMPVLTIVLGVVNAYGSFVDVFSLRGILIAHLYLNVPYAIRILWERLSRISQTQIQIAQTLHMSPWQNFLFIKLPVIVIALRPIFILIFLLCFSSFTIVLTLGGGPANTNLEVAIFQALKFDFDPRAGAVYAIIHGAIAMLFMLALGKREVFSMEIEKKVARIKQRPTALQSGVMLIVLIVLLYPLFSLALHSLTQPWAGSQRIGEAISTSLLLAVGSGLFATLLALCRSLDVAQSRFVRIVDYGLMILPIMVISTGLFLLALRLQIAFKITVFLIIWLNGLMAMPLILGPLTSRVAAFRKSYERLSQTLALTSWQQFKFVYLPALVRVLPWSFVLAMVLSVGDLGVAALLGSAQFVTIPILIYQAMGSYQMVLASQLTLLLLFICSGLLIVAEWFGERSK